MTGDVTISTDSSCLVMTTEILRSMLYRGSEVMREVKWVIFDEVHYMRDAERGVVWEEVMILLPPQARAATPPPPPPRPPAARRRHHHRLTTSPPPQVRFVFLSATIPNAFEFAEWIAGLHKQPCHVVYTDYRPTPLLHYACPSGGDGMHLVLDERGNFKPSNFAASLAAIKPAGRGGGGDGGGRGGGKGGRGGKGGKGGRGGRDKQEADSLSKLVTAVVGRGYQPLIIFAFGKNKCERIAQSFLRENFELTNAEERGMIDEIYKNAIDTLSADDQKLPQVEGILPLLRRGIAVHHSGLLPLLKELVEILFQENLVKMLIATETFAMGLNMPAKTVIFAELSKFDGTAFRYLTSGEYIQMSGRAGRRGLDDRGIVIQLLTEEQAKEAQQVKGMLCGTADTLTSKFHLSYNMLLNCMRVEAVDISHIISHSFHAFQTQRELPALKAELSAKQAALRAHAAIPHEALASELHHALAAAEEQREALRAEAHRPINVVPFIQTGRLAKIRKKRGNPHGTWRKNDPVGVTAAGGEGAVEEWGWGVIVNFRRHTMPKEKAKKPHKREPDKGPGEAWEYTVDVLLRCEAGAEAVVAAGGDPTPPGEGEDDAAELHALSVNLTEIIAFSTVKVSMPKELRTADGRYSVLRVVREVERRFGEGGAVGDSGAEGIPVLDPINDLKLDEDDDPDRGTKGVKKVLRRLEAVESRLAEPRLKAPEVEAALVPLRARMEKEAEEKALRKKIKAGEAVLLQEELKGMHRVLRRLGHTTDEGIVLPKGRVACEVSATDELLMTEMLFSGVFNEAEPAQLAALLSCLVVVGNAKEDDKKKGGGAMAVKNAALRELVLRLQESARRVATVVEESRLPVNADEYVKKFSPALVDVVHDWCNGAKFAELMTMVPEGMYEGSVIRTMHRLEELLRQLIDGAKVVGNTELEAKCAAARELIVRDVVFAASLYT